MAERKYWWFHGTSVEAIVRRLQAANPATCRLEVRIDEADKMTLRVVPAISAATVAGGDPDVNESHLCPPDCQ